jgi:hypothetical protein
MFYKCEKCWCKFRILEYGNSILENKTFCPKCKKEVKRDIQLPKWYTGLK